MLLIYTLFMKKRAFVPEESMIGDLFCFALFVCLFVFLLCIAFKLPNDFFASRSFFFCFRSAWVLPCLVFRLIRLIWCCCGNAKTPLSAAPATGEATKAKRPRGKKNRHNEAMW